MYIYKTRIQIALKQEIFNRKLHISKHTSKQNFNVK